MRNEIFSKDIPKCQNILLFAFPVLDSYYQWRNQNFKSGWKIKLKVAHWSLCRAH